MNSENHKYFYSNFDEIEDFELRAWNRYNIILNMGERFGLGSGIAKEYLSQFSVEDKKSITKLAGTVSRVGFEEVRRELFRKEIANA